MKPFGVIRDREIETGDYLVPDGWRGLGGLLQQGDAPVDSSYHGSQFRIETGNYTTPSCPVNLTITGRTMQYGRFSAPAVRVRIEWVHDGEPNDSSSGWLIFNH